MQIAGYESVVRDGDILHTVEVSGKRSWLTVDEARCIVRDLSAAIGEGRQGTFGEVHEDFICVYCEYGTTLKFDAPCSKCRAVDGFPRFKGRRLLEPQQ